MKSITSHGTGNEASLLPITNTTKVGQSQFRSGGSGGTERNKSLLKRLTGSSQWYERQIFRLHVEESRFGSEWTLLREENTQKDLDLTETVRRDVCISILQQSSYKTKYKDVWWEAGKLGGNELSKETHYTLTRTLGSESQRKDGRERTKTKRGPAFCVLRPDDLFTLTKLRKCHNKSTKSTGTRECLQICQLE